jgi:hypothetical protein
MLRPGETAIINKLSADAGQIVAVDGHRFEETTDRRLLCDANF